MLVPVLIYRTLRKDLVIGAPDAAPQDLFRERRRPFVVGTVDDFRRVIDRKLYQIADKTEKQDDNKTSATY